MKISIGETGHRKTKGKFTELLINSIPNKTLPKVLALIPIFPLLYTKHFSEGKIHGRYCISLIAGPLSAFRKHTLINEPMHKL